MHAWLSLKEKPGNWKNAPAMSETDNKVLLVEDDWGVAGLVKVALDLASYSVTHVEDGLDGLKEALTGAYQVLLLDVKLPGLDGLTLCREARKSLDTPILMLSAQREDYDKITGLEAGADDYLAKPFNPIELLARIRALLRRSQRNAGRGAVADSQLSAGEISLDLATREVRVNGIALHLTPKEFDLLRCLVSHPDQILMRHQLMDMCWGPLWVGDERTVDVHLRRMRKKLLPVTDHEYFLPARGVGYRLCLPNRS